jgi:hypothetical protein
MAIVTIILAKRGAGMSDMPVPGAIYDGVDVNTITTAENTTLTASLENQFWFVSPHDAAVRVLERVASVGDDVTSTTGWYVPAGTRWEAKATNGSTLSLIAV